jgi:hypothetical protein
VPKDRLDHGDREGLSGDERAELLRKPRRSMLEQFGAALDLLGSVSAASVAVHPAAGFEVGLRWMRPLSHLLPEFLQVAWQRFLPRGRPSANPAFPYKRLLTTT